MEILGVKVNNLDKQEILEKIRSFLNEPKFHQITTINPEIILETQKNKNYKNILNNCDLNLADGIGIKFAFWRFGKKLKCRIAGADLMLEVLKIAVDLKLSVFLAVNKDGLSNFKEIEEALLKIYPDLVIEGVDLEKNVSDFRLQVSCPILFCNFGAPHQEIFINSIKCDTIRLAMGIGGSFDFLTGKVARAPKFMQITGFEWLWRLFQPQEWKFKKERIKRILKAVLVFPIKLIIWNLKKNHLNKK